jgi:hypothetical protein
VSIEAPINIRIAIKDASAALVSLLSTGDDVLVLAAGSMYFTVETTEKHRIQLNRDRISYSYDD